MSKKKQKKQTIDIAIENNFILITRNYEKSELYEIKEGKELLALIDAIMHPGKYNVYIHDLRSKEVYSSLTGCIENGEFPIVS